LKRALLIALVLAALVVSTEARGGATVRGLLFRVAPNGQQYPAQGIMVRLNHPQYGPSSPTYTGGDGMYYLFNIPPGRFTLEIWLSKDHVLPYVIDVCACPVHNVAPIRIP